MKAEIHRYNVGEKVYIGLDGEKEDIIVEQVQCTEGSDVLEYVLQNEGFIFESSIAYSEKELNGEIK